MFAQDFGDIPGLDVIFLLGGYFYHTASDTVERLLYASQLLFWHNSPNWNFKTITSTWILALIHENFFQPRPGSIQARGDNLFRIIKAFTSSSNLQNAHQRRLRSAVNGSDNERAVFFDYLSWFLVSQYFSRWRASLFIFLYMKWNQIGN